MEIMSKIKEFLASSLIILLSFLFTVALLEGSLRLTKYKYLLGEDFPRFYYEADAQAGYDIAKNFPAFNYRFGEISCQAWSNNIGCFDSAYRGERDYILLVGDSFAWGYAPFEYKMGSVIEGFLGQRVLKCGVRGYSTKQELLKIKKIVEETRCRPRLIIVGYCLFNDFTDDTIFPNCTVINGYMVRKVSVSPRTGEKTVYCDDELKAKMKNWVECSGNMAQSCSFISQAAWWMRKHSILYNIARKASALREKLEEFGLAKKRQEKKLYQDRVYARAKPEPWIELAWQEHLRTLKEIKELADSYGAGLLVFLIPLEEQVYDFLKPIDSAYDFDKPNRELAQFFSKESIPCLDLTGVFRKYADQRPRKRLDPLNDLFWRDDVHFNIKGNRLAALAILKYIADYRLIQVPAEVKSAVEKELERFD
jgi:hypothetical protein